MFDPPNMGPMKNDLCNKALCHDPIECIGHLNHFPGRA